MVSAGITQHTCSSILKCFTKKTLCLRSDISVWVKVEEKSYLKKKEKDEAFSQRDWSNVIEILSGPGVKEVAPTRWQNNKKSNGKVHQLERQWYGNSSISTKHNQET